MICIDSLTVGYDGRTVLWDVSFEIGEGRLVGIIGPNGAGKSSLLKAAAGLLKPLAGSISIHGLPPKRARRAIAYVPQREAIDWDFPITVFEVALMGRYASRGPFRRITAADREATHLMLDRVGLGECEGRQIGELSGGQQQRLFIARALLQQGVDIYLLDEPFSGVDMTTEREIIALLRRLRDDGKTVIVVHHDPATVRLYFDEIALLSTSLVAYGDPEEVFTQKNVAMAYGVSGNLLEEASLLSERQASL